MASDPPGTVFCQYFRETVVLHSIYMGSPKYSSYMNPIDYVLKTAYLPKVFAADFIMQVFEWMALTTLISVVQRRCFVAVVSGLNPYGIIGCARVLYMLILLSADINLFFQTRLERQPERFAPLKTCDLTSSLRFRLLEI